MWSGFAGDIVGAIVALLIGAIGTYGGIYIKKMETKLKRKMLLDEVNRYVAWAQEAQSFKLMSSSEKIETVFTKAIEFAEENEIKISDKELNIMVERAVQSLSRLETIGLRLMRKHLSEKQGEVNHDTIKK